MHTIHKIHRQFMHFMKITKNSYISQLPAEKSKPSINPSGLSQIYKIRNASKISRSFSRITQFYCSRRSRIVSAIKREKSIENL
jgi:hypothetical protein